MDNLEFAKAMIQYEELYKELKTLEEQIGEYVLNKGESQAIGNVTAKYSNGRTQYDYEAVNAFYPPEIMLPVIDRHSQEFVKIDWRSVCEEMKFEAPIKVQPTPSVSVKVKIE